MTKKFNLINYNVFVRLFLALTFSPLLSRLSNDKRGMERSEEEEEKLTLSHLLLRSPLTTRREEDDESQSAEREREIRSLYQPIMHRKRLFTSLHPQSSILDDDEALAEDVKHSAKVSKGEGGEERQKGGISIRTPWTL